MESLPLASLNASIFLTVLAVSFSAFLLHAWRRSKSKPKLSNLPPGPPGLPVLGNLLQLGEKPHETFLSLSSKYGPIFSLRFGGKTTVVVSSIPLLEQIIKKQDQIFAGRFIVDSARPYSFCETDVALNHPGPLWKLLRKICTTHIFTAKKLQALESLRKKQLDRCIRYVLECYVSKKAVDIQHVVFGCVVNVVANLIFGRDICEHGSAEMAEFRETIAEAARVGGKPSLVDFFPIPKPLDFLPIPNPLDPFNVKKLFAKFVGKIRSTFEGYLQERLRESPEAGHRHIDFLAVLIECHRNGELGLEEIRNLIVEMFIAGSDTSTISVQWAMAELIRKPEAMKRCHEELDAVVGRSRRIEEKDENNLLYLSAIKKETLRLHPPIHMIPRRTLEDAQLGEYFIPKDSHVFLNIWATARDPSIWEDPLEFHPERFLNSNVDYKGQHLQLLPFGGGRRICVGMPLGSIMSFIILGSLLPCFEWRLPARCDELDMSDKPGMVLHMASRLQLVPIPRLPSDLY